MVFLQKQLGLVFPTQVSLIEGCGHMMAQLGLEDPFPRCFAHMNDKMVLTVGFCPQSPLCWTAWESTMAYYLIFSKASNPRDQGETCNAFHNLALRSYAITPRIFHWPHRSTLIQCGSRLHP